LVGETITWQTAFKAGLLNGCNHLLSG